MAKVKSGNDVVWVGKARTKDLIDKKKFPWFESGFSAFHVQSVDTTNKDTWKVTIVAGTWCSDTQRELPKWVKILKERRIPQSNTQILLVDHAKSNPWFSPWSMDITNIPAIIFYKNGQEIGRLIEQTGNNTEHEIDSILRLGR